MVLEDPQVLEFSSVGNVPPFDPDGSESEPCETDGWDSSS